jgi:uncharacterized protein YegL
VKRDNKVAMEAVFVSLSIHVMFLAMSPWLFFSGTMEKKEHRDFFQVKIEKPPTQEEREQHDKILPPPDSRPKVPAVRMSKQGVKTTSAVMKNMMLGENAQKDVDLDKKREKLRPESLNDTVPQERKLDRDLLGVETGKTKKDAMPPQRTLLQKSDKGVVSDKTGEPTVLKSMEYKIDRKGFSWANVVIDMNNAFSSGKNKFGGPGGGQEIGEYEFNGVLADRDQYGDYDDIDEFLDIKLSKYVDEATGERYFKLTIKAKEGINFKVIPKETIFLIDSSKSITAEKLEHIKIGLMSSLRYMNKGDRFNVIAFSGNLVKFREKSVEANDKMIMEAVNFIKQLGSVGQTDVNKALLDIVGEAPAFYPSYVVLLTDGKPTTGVTNSRNIIKEITKHNNMDRPIFTFGGGSRVNKYLLDFMAYQNRGWSRFADTMNSISSEFQSLYKQIKDPLFLNVRYRLINIDEEEVYPKYLPDFYKDKEMNLYGRFGDDDLFSMQLLGEIGNETKELILKRSLMKADKGGPEIARNWAFSKIYYLISQDSMGMGGHEEIMREINELGKKYGIMTPYDLDEKID